MILFRIETSTACVWSETGPRALGSPFRNSSAVLSSPSAFSFQSAKIPSMAGQGKQATLNYLADKIKLPTVLPLPEILPRGWR